MILMCTTMDNNNKIIAFKKNVKEIHNENWFGEHMRYLRKYPSYKLHLRLNCDRNPPSDRQLCPESD